MGKMKCKIRSSLEILPSINIWWIWIFILSLLVGHTYEQGTRREQFPQAFNAVQASPLVSQRQSGIPSQQVIVPGGFQQQLFTSHFPSRNSRVASPQATSVQNQQFGFFPQDQLTNTRPSVLSSSSSAGRRQTEGRGQPNFIGLAFPPAQQQQTSRAIKANNPHVVATNGDIQYEYYDEPEEDVIYQYGADINDQTNQGRQHHSLVTPKAVVGKGIQVQDESLTRSQQPSRTHQLAAKPNNRPTHSLSISLSNLPSPTSGSSPIKSSPSRGSSRPTSTRYREPVNQAKETSSSSFIPLIDEGEEVDPILALNGRSVHPNLQTRVNNLSIRPPNAFIRSTTAPSSLAPVVAESQTERSRERTRGSFTRNPTTAPPTARSREIGTLTTTKRPGVLRGNRFTVTARPPVVPRTKNINNNSSKEKETKEDQVQTSSSTYRPDPTIQKSLRSHPKKEKYVLHPPSPSADASADDYTVEYVEYPVGPEEDKSAFEYYEVSEETAAAILGNRTHAETLEKKPKVTSSKSKSIPPKVTSSVSVSSKSSSTTATTSSTTTPAPFIAPSSSEENISSEGKGEVVISVATTKSVSGSKGEDFLSVTPSPVTPTPRVSFSRATGSSVVVASVQTSKSVFSGSKPTRASKSVATEAIRDNIPSGAETSPEYYEEEYSYPDNFPVLTSEAGAGNDPTGHHHSTSTSVSSSSNVKSEEGRSPVLESLSTEGEGDQVESEVEKESDDVKAEDERSFQPQGRKLPSKHGENVPIGHFETLIDFGELESDQHIPIVHEQELEEKEVPPSSSTTTTSTTTTTTSTTTPASNIEEANIPAKTIKFAEISPNLLPPGFKFPSPTAEEGPSSTTTSTTTTTTTTTQSPSLSSDSQSPVNFDDVPSFLLPKGYRPLGTKGTTTTTTTTTSAPPSTSSTERVQYDEIPSALLPKGYKPFSRVGVTPSTTPRASETSTTEKYKSPLEAILSKVQFKEIAIPDLIPKDYKLPTESSKGSDQTVGINFQTPANLLPPGYKPEPISPIKFEVPNNLLPPGFKPSSGSSEPVAPIKFEIPSNLLPAGFKPSGATKPETSPSSSPIATTKKPGGLIFPTKPGGFRVTRPTTTEGPKANTPPPPRVTLAAAGWPQRKTTEFTGWPTSSTTPMPSTSSTSTTTTTEKPTTTTTTTTTTPPPPKRSLLGKCPNEVCRMEATIRIIGGVKWKPEYADINTDEYKQLEITVKRELDGAFRASGLAPWYKRVQIEGFNRGSVLVDYFVELEGVDRELSTADVVKVFHKSLLDSDPGDELPLETDAPGHLPVNGGLRFGRYSVDPRYTDFKVVNKKTEDGPPAPEPLIPQWGIAVIVIGLVSLLFVFLLGITVLVNRHKNSKKKNAVSLTQEMLNEFNKSHLPGGVDNYGADDLYNMDDVWNDKQMNDRTFDRRPTKRSQGSGKGSANYNIYDSWKTEWNGHYYNGNYYGDSGYAPSRRRSDYDTNF